MKAEANQKINILNYLNYRTFLKDFYVLKKKQKSEYSYRLFQLKGGLSSPSHLKMITEGQRNLTQATIIKYIRALNLNKPEARYFELLVLFNQTKDKDKDLKESYFTKVMNEKNKKGLNQLALSQYNFLAHWYMVAIYTLIDLDCFINDVDWIISKLRKKIGKKDIAKTFETLLELGLIVKTDDGSYRQTKGAISTAEDIRAMAVQRYHSNMIQLGLFALSELEMSTREFNGVTLPINKKNLPLLKEKIRQFRKEINQLASSLDAPDEVYQMNIQLFPLTEDRQ